MEFTAEYKDHIDEIVGLFAAAFADSEGPEEGQVIGALARNLIQNTNPDDIFVYSARDDDELVGCIVFSRMTFAQDERRVFILSPVAVKTNQQGKGTGVALLTYGLRALRGNGVDVAITYGDPKYYVKVGFAPITDQDAKPPFTLRQPEGWLAQSLTQRRLDPLKGASHCVDALNNPDYW